MSYLHTYIRIFLYALYLRYLSPCHSVQYCHPGHRSGTVVIKYLSLKSLWSLWQSIFLQNEPNFLRSKMTVSHYLILTSIFYLLTSACKSNPIRTQTKPNFGPKYPLLAQAVSSPESPI